jgi:hypothetical protein
MQYRTRIAIARIINTTFKYIGLSMLTLIILATWAPIIAHLITWVWLNYPICLAGVCALFLIVWVVIKMFGIIDNWSDGRPWNWKCD